MSAERRFQFGQPVIVNDKRRGFIINHRRIDCHWHIEYQVAYEWQYDGENMASVGWFAADLLKPATPAREIVELVEAAEFYADGCQPSCSTRHQEASYLEQPCDCGYYVLMASIAAAREMVGGKQS